MTPGSCAMCAEQIDHLAAVGEDQDVASLQQIEDWHHNYHQPERGPFLPVDPAYGDGWAGRTTHADTLTLADVTVRADEMLCLTCFLVHRPGCCDR